MGSKKRAAAASDPAHNQRAVKQQRAPAAEPAQQQQPPRDAEQPPARSDGGFKNREKVLVLGSRGITYRSRHLMADVLALLPHSKKDVKLDTKSDRGVINEVAEEKGCSSALFFESRKRQDLYLWMAKAPDGPTAKFLVLNVHTMDELKLTGNHLRGSRPLLSFDAAFDAQPHLQLLKEVLGQVFATPGGHHRAKPFFDHVLSFSLADGAIWLRNYQVVMPLDKRRADPGTASLVEVGPRAALRPIRVFEGSFGGRVLYDNPEYVAPSTLRRLAKARAAGRYGARVAARAKRRAHEAAHAPPADELEGPREAVASARRRGRAAASCAAAAAAAAASGAPASGLPIAAAAAAVATAAAAAAAVAALAATGTRARAATAAVRGEAAQHRGRERPCQRRRLAQPGRLQERRRRAATTGAAVITLRAPPPRAARAVTSAVLASRSHTKPAALRRQHRTQHLTNAPSLPAGGMAEAEISPGELKFRFQLNKQLPAAISIHNPGGERLAFKVKTTTPKKYVVRPSSGAVEPRSTANVQVIMQAQKELPPDFASCKDKFLVQVKALEAGEEITQDTFKAGKGVKDTKIRVLLEGPPAPPSPVPEVNEVDEDAPSRAHADGLSSAAVTAPGADPASLGQENRALRAQLERLLAERDALRTKLDKAGRGAAAAPGGSRASAGPSVASVLPVLLVGLLAFLVGHYLHSVPVVSKLLGKEEARSVTARAARESADTKIRVLLEGPPAPPSPVPEVNELDEDAPSRAHADGLSSAAVTAPGADPASLGQENRALRAQLERLLAERDALRTKLDKAGRGAAAAPGGSRASAGPSAVSVLPVLLVGLLAFLVGHYLHSVPVVSKLLGKEEARSVTARAARESADTKIRVLLEGPPAPPSPVPEVNELDEDAPSRAHADGLSSAAVTAPGADPASLGQENRALRAQLERLLAERDALRTKLDKAGRGAAAAPGGSRASAGPSAVSVLPVLLVGLLAFLVGHYLHSVPVRAEQFIDRFCEVDTESVGHVLCKKAEELDAAAIVMASHNKDRVAEFFLGSVSQYCTHHSKRPVVIAPAK
ncbi:BRIX1-1 [Scenedesmus sp. PABB004]|nr:BRIX1-1 [Scenedesmus sp. PABB004]